MTDAATPTPADEGGQGLSANDLDAAKRVQEAHKRIRAELSKTIVGLDDVIDQLLISIFARGHCLLVGVPGLAKTLLISTVSKCLSLSFNRIQFTPDLMPADITGTEVIQEDRSTGQRGFKFIRGPIFANVILADEINRTPPKTQAALLEAMQERQVTAGGRKHPLDPPFFVLATQNPIEQEGTYPLPEAQLDRFMFLVKVDYPSLEEELSIVDMTTKPMSIEHSEVLTGEEILSIQDVVRRVPISEHMVRYVLNLVRATRPNKDEAPEYVRTKVAWGAGPRASQFLILGAKARALLHGRMYVAAEDIQRVAYPVLRHRVIMNYAAEAEGFTSDTLVDELLANIPASESETLRDERLPNVLGS
ncbi:MAG: MoxR family ATPase [Planctomycetota bacterium]|nr:MoxR family ATPase [Planctomycetota bacterium]